MEVEMDKPVIDGMAQVTRWDDHFERGDRCRKRSKAALWIGALLLLIGGVEWPGAIEAQQVGPREEDARASTSLAEARCRVALRALNSIEQRVASGKGCANRDALIDAWSRRWLIARIELSRGHADRVASFDAHLARMKDLEGRAKAQYGERRISDLERLEAEFQRLQAESWLTKENQGKLPWIIEITD
jgi:hypothetical protein